MEQSFHIVMVYKEDSSFQSRQAGTQHTIYSALYMGGVSLNLKLGGNLCAFTKRVDIVLMFNS